MAEMAVTFLLEQVKELVKGDMDLISGAESEFNQLKDELNLLKGILEDAANESKDEYMFRELERQIREVVYEVEDIIDTCLTKAIVAKAKSARRSLLFSRKKYNLAKEVKSIREETVLPMLEKVKLNFAKMRIDDGPGGAEYPRTTELNRYEPIRENRIVGFEDEEATITHYLLEETDRLDVISIIGIPGQGKTTLASKIYQNDHICYNFPIRIWVYISQNLNTRDVFLQIMRKFTPSQDISDLNDYELAQMVRACLERERFLLVLDDVWSVEAWSEIKEVLPENNGLGKVLITSRVMDVGMHSNVYRRPHRLRFLTADESWTLLQYEVFGDVESCPPELVSIGQQIAIRCDGVPMTISIVGGILANQLRRSLPLVESNWNKVANSISETLQSDTAQRIIDVVILSFNILPGDLRDCFIYLGIFPEDYEIPVKMLYGLWISEGFVQPRDGRSLEEAAEENLRDLISRSLVKVEKTNHMGKVKTCRVLSMIRAFCINKSEDVNLYKVIRKSGTASEVQNSRRLCVHSHLSHFLSSCPNGPRVRSFLCFYNQPLDLPPEYTSVIPDGFPKIRILESKSIKFSKFPSKVTKLFHLRYLTLSIDTLAILPEPISQLWNLQTLILETKSRSITMKANIWNMFRMRHLRTKAAIVLDNTWQGDAGENLQTLNRLSPESCTEVVSEKAKNLETLGICGKLANIFGTKFLEKLQRLEKLKLVNSITYETTSEKLKLVNSITYETTSEDHPPSLPHRNCFPPYLKRLTLVNTFLQWEQMSSLAQIKTLEVLKLKDNAFAGVYWDAGGYCFPCLEVLHILNADLVIWEASSESFPSLRCLVLKNCENVKEIPDALAQTTLEKLEIDRVRESAVASARKILEQKHYRAQHEKAKPRVPLHLSIGSVSYR